MNNCFTNMDAWSCSPACRWTSYYDKYGDQLLLVSFFIPGVRQFIGIIRVPYRKVLQYAYTEGRFMGHCTLDTTKRVQPGKMDLVKYSFRIKQLSTALNRWKWTKVGLWAGPSFSTGD
nr:hypothetical protein [Fontibacillus phaseoli]